MAFTYDPAALTQSLNRLRFMVQDTVDQGHFFEDEEITFAAAQDSNIYRVAADLCRVIAAKLAAMPEMDAGAAKFDAGDRARTYMQLAAKYDEKAAEIQASLTANGDSSTLVLPALPQTDTTFSRGLHFSSDVNSDPSRNNC